MSITTAIIAAVVIPVIISAGIWICVKIAYGKNQRRRPGCVVLPVILVVLACIVIVENGGILWINLWMLW